MKKHHHVAFSLYNWINRTKLARGLHKTLKDFTLSFLYPRTTFMMLRFFNKSIIMYQKKKKKSLGNFVGLSIYKYEGKLICTIYLYIE